MRRKSIRAAAAILSLSFLGIPASSSAGRTPGAPDYAVYQAVLTNLGSQTQSGPFVLIDRTRTYKVPDSKLQQHIALIKSKLQVSDDTLADFLSKRREHEKLIDLFPSSSQVQLASQQQLDDIFKGHEDGWERFYTAYPGSQGLATLSRVGFNAAGTEALLCASSACGLTCGKGLYYLMRLQDGNWIVAGKMYLWVS